MITVQRARTSIEEGSLLKGKTKASILVVDDEESLTCYKKKATM